MHVDAPTIDRDVLAISGDQPLGTVNLRDEFDATKLVRLPAVSTIPGLPGRGVYL